MPSMESGLLLLIQWLCFFVAIFCFWVDGHGRGYNRRVREEQAMMRKLQSTPLSPRSINDLLADAERMGLS